MPLPPIPNAPLRSLLAASVTIENHAPNSDTHPRSNATPVTPREPKFTKRGEDLSG